MHTDWSDAKDPIGNSTTEFIHRIEVVSTLQSQQSHKISGAIWVPLQHAEPLGIVAFGHGASGDRYQNPIAYMASKLSEKGFFCLAMDGPVHGLRRVEPGGRAALSKAFQRPQLVDEMVADWRVSMDELKKRFDIQDNVFGYFGLSMGSIFGIPYVADRCRRNKPVHVAGFGLLGNTGAVAAMASRLNTDACEITCPLLFLWQLEDELFPRDGCIGLFDQFASDAKTLHANPGRHPEVPGHEVDFAIDFIASQLQR